MTPLKRNLSKLLFITLVIILGGVVSGLIYYVKMGQNEETLNTLLFRELQQVEGTLQRSLEKIKATTKYLLPDTPTAPHDSPDYKNTVKQAVRKLAQADDLAGAELKSFEIKSVSEWPYATSRTFTFTIPTYDTAFVVHKNYYAGDNTVASIVLKTPVHHALKQRVRRFQTVALVDDQGRVMSMVNHTDRLSNETELFIRQIVNLNSQHGDTAKPLQIKGTRYEDVELSNTALRLYIHPIMSKGLTTGDDNYYLVGVIAKQQIIEEKLKLSHSLLMWLILGLLLLMALIPLLKLRFVNSSYAIQQSDKSQIVLGFILAIGIVSIGVTQELFFDYFKNVKKQQLSQLHNAIRQDFQRELEQVLPAIADMSTRISESAGDTEAGSGQQDSPLTSFYRNQLYDSSTALAQAGPQVLGIDHDFIESAFHFNEHGEVLENTPLLMISEQLFVQQALDVTKRRYVIAATKHQFWYHGSQPFFIERVFNIEDGRRNAMVSMPASPPTNNASYVAGGTRFESLVDRVLPNNFGFAVITPGGDVVFHSDDNLSLIENFFTEANRNPELLSAAKHSHAGSDVPMDIIYQGEPHSIVIGPLLQQKTPSSSSGKPLPWQLVVFYNPEDLQANNMIMVFLAVLLYLLIIIPSFLLLRYLTYQRFWQELCYFDDTRQSLYVGLSILLFATSVAIQFQMGLLQTLTSRLLLWSAVSLILLSFLKWRFDIHLYQYSKLRQPLTACGVILLVIAAIFTTQSQVIFLTPVSVNKGFALAGAVLVLLALAFAQLFTPQTHTHPHREAKQSSRVSTGYLWFITGLLFIAASVPAGLIAHSAHEYLLQRQARFEQSHIQHTLEVRQQQYKDYLSSIFDTDCPSVQSPSVACELQPAPLASLDFVMRSVMPANVYCSDEHTRSECWASLLEPAPAGQNTGSLTKTYRPNLTDDLFDKLFSLMYSDSGLVSHLTYAAKADLAMAAPAQPEPILQYRADLLMLSATSQGGGFFTVVLLMLGLPFGIFFSVRQMIVQRLMGENLHDQYRVLKDCTLAKLVTQTFPKLDVTEALQRGHSQLIINATRQEAEKAMLDQELALFRQKVHRITDCLDHHYAINEHTREFQLVADVKAASQRHQASPCVIAISAVEQVSLDRALRQQALDLLYALHMEPGILLVIIAETSPLYRLLMPASYQTVADAAEPNIDEKAAWSKLFSEFEKHYAWSPICKGIIGNPFDIKQLIDHECEGWPELYRVRCKFDEFTEAVHGKNPHRTSAQMPDRATQHYQQHWFPEQVIEFMLVHAGPLYRRKWEECTTKEKLILWKVAHGASVNPASAAIIEHLVRRCYLYRDKGWHLINESFRQFILTAESEAVINQWLDNTSTGAWSILRIPLFALLLVLLVVFIYSSGSSLNTILSVATATLGLIPLLIKNVSLLKAGSGTELE